jgi:hypothetical protein
MKRYLKNLFIWLFLGSLAFAGTGLEQRPGEPPFGLKVQGDAKGTKLDGVISIEFYNCGPDPSPEPKGTLCDARIALRLRQGNTAALQMFFGDLTDVIASSPAAVQTAIEDTLEQQVVAAFFPGQNLTTTLKNVTEYGRIEVSTDFTPPSIFVLADVQIAVS